MNKQALIAALAEREQLTKARAAELVEALFGTDGLIASELRRCGRVQVTGFGNFEVRKRKGRTMRNPRTGKQMTIAATVTPVFRAGRALKAAVERKR